MGTTAFPGAGREAVVGPRGRLPSSGTARWDCSQKGEGSSEPPWVRGIPVPCAEVTFGEVKHVSVINRTENNIGLSKQVTWSGVDSSMNVTPRGQPEFEHFEVVFKSATNQSFTCTTGAYEANFSVLPFSKNPRVVTLLYSIPALLR